MATILKSIGGLQLFSKYLKQSVEVTTTAKMGKRPNPPPRKRIPPWLPTPERVQHEEHLTPENQEFVENMIKSKYNLVTGATTSPLKHGPIEPNTEWTARSRRPGVIAKKIGVYPMWLKDGTKVTTTLLQVYENEVVKYIPPEVHKTRVGRTNELQIRNKLGCLLIGAESVTPDKVTKGYYNIFENSGVIPKKHLFRFFVTPDAALQPGTPLLAGHFQPGDRIDVRGKTVDRGFQGVMKRWGFKGMPASHGVTKTHRRPGNIGSGSACARVWPGTKLPGNMGNRWRRLVGVRVLRVNTKYNVLWVLGQNLPGETGSFCYLYDTILPLRKRTTAPYFPTYLPEVHGELPEESYVDDLHQFASPTITFDAPAS